MIKYICEKCGKETFEKYGSGRFCSRNCANSRTFSEESNKKRSESNKQAYLSNPSLREKCSERMKNLNASFIVAPMKGKHLSEEAKNKISLARKGKKVSEETREKCRASALKRVADGSHKGWQVRNITSYAEKFWIEVLKNELPNENYVREFHFGKYFLDFFFEKKKLDLEIDGKQHEYEDRKESDLARDAFLKENNIIVYRIKWNSINTENGKNLMKEKIRSFINFYNSLPIAQE